MEAELKSFAIVTEYGTKLHVWATDEAGAMEEYYQTLESILGHQLGICHCFQNQPIDRDKVARISAITLSAGA